MKTRPNVARKGVKERSVAVENFVGGAQVPSSQEEKLMLMVRWMLGWDAEILLYMFAGRIQIDK
jgi:hypothetical protein